MSRLPVEVEMFKGLQIGLVILFLSVYPANSQTPRDLQMKQSDARALGELWSGLTTKSETVENELKANTEFVKLSPEAQIQKLLSLKNNLRIQTKPKSTLLAYESKSAEAGNNTASYLKFAKKNRLEAEAVKLQRLWSRFCNLENSKEERQSIEKELTELCGLAAVQNAKSVRQE